MQKGGTKDNKTKTPKSKCPWELGLVPPLKNLNALPGRDAECCAKEYVRLGERKEVVQVSIVSFHADMSSD